MHDEKCLALTKMDIVRNSNKTTVNKLNKSLWEGHFEIKLLML